MNHLLERLLLAMNDNLSKHTGFRVKRSQVEWDAYRKNLLKKLNIEVVLDVGANRGQWANRVLKDLEKPSDIEMWSFEPASSSFSILTNEAKRNPNWHVLQIALGRVDGTSILNLSSNESQSASIRRPKEHLSHFQSVEFHGFETIQVQRLDNFASDLAGKRIYLKLDVQGFEKEVLEGSSGLLDWVKAIEIETSFFEMYEGQALHFEILTTLNELGFSVRRYSEPALTDFGDISYIDAIAIKD